MNLQQINQLKFEEVLLQKLRIVPTIRRENSLFYISPFRPNERTPSFHITEMHPYDLYFDHGCGLGGKIVDFFIKFLNITPKGVLEYFNENSFSFQRQKSEQIKIENIHKNYEISKVREIEHPALLEYLEYRKVENQIEFLKEIHYRMHDKNYFGIGFKNDSGGYEIRHKYSKICLGKKDISTIKNGSNTLRIFEGFFDFLSFKNVENYLGKNSSDYIILNTVAMIANNRKSFHNYENVELYFDNDAAGNKAVELIKNELGVIEDCRALYSDFKDLSDWWVSSDKLEEKLGRSSVQKVPKVYNKRNR